MKKIILIISLAFLLTGCTVEYNATFTKDFVEENVKTRGANYNTLPVASYITEQGASEEDTKIEGVEYYTIQDSNDLKTFSYKFPWDRYNESRAINTCLKSSNITKMADGNFLLNTSSYFSCLDLYPTITNLIINLTFNPVDYEIISNNADNYSNNTYTWNINQQNYRNKNIQVIFKSLKEETEQPTKPETPSIKPEEKSNKYSTLIIVGSFLGLFSLIGVICYIKSKRL